MQSWIAWLIAVASAALCLHLWFRAVRRIMRDRKNTVESAAGQLSVCRKKAAEARQDSGVAEVLRRSQSIYTQAVDHYNATLRKPWVHLPAVFLGLRPIKPAREI